MVKKATTKKGTTAGTATKGTRPPRKKGAGNAEPPQRKPVRQRRRGDYDYAQHGKTRTGSIPGDLTIKPAFENKVQIVRPDFDHGDSLIFRPLPCLDDTDENQANCKWSSYRRSIDPFQFSDFMRAYPATKYVGTTDDRFTFLLYDKARAQQEGYDKKQNPYILLYNTIANAKKKRTLPNMDWLQLLEGKDSFLGRPTTLYFLQGLIFKRGEEMYVGGGRSPRGAGVQDKAQIIQLSSSAGQALERMMNEVNADFTGNPEHWENSMIHGDIVAPKFGRFIRVQNPKKLQGQANTSLEGLDSWQMGGDAHEQQSSSGGDNFRGYTVSVDDVFISGGRRTKLKPRLTPEQSKALKSTIQWWDEILYVPETDELCLIIAKALRAASAAIEFAWQDHPDYLTGDVQKVLANATQVLVAGPVSVGQDLEFDQMADRVSGVVPTEEETAGAGADDGSYSEGYDESDEYVEDEAGAEVEVGEPEPAKGEAEPDEQTWVELGEIVDNGDDPDHALEKSMEEACGVYEIVSNDYAKWQGLGVKLDELDAEAELSVEVEPETAGDDGGGGYDEEYANTNTNTNTEPEASVEAEPPTVEGEYEGEYEEDAGTAEAAPGDPAYEFEEDFPDANEGNQEVQDEEEASMSEAFAAADSRSSKRGTKKTTTPKKSTPKKTVSKKPPVKKGAKGKKAKGKKKS